MMTTTKREFRSQGYKAGGWYSTSPPPRIDWQNQPRCKSCGNPRDLLAHSPEEVLCVLCADMAAGRMGWYKRWGLDITMSPPQPQGSLKDDEV